MKLLIIFAAFLLASSLHSQSITYNYEVHWDEQESGVATRLNCVASPDTGPGLLVYACGVNGTVIQTTNKGETWNFIGSNGLPSNIDLKTLEVISYNTVVTAGNIGNITYVYRTENGGKSWSMVFSQENGKINSVCRPDIANYVFMQGDPVGGRWSLWKSYDNGMTWDSAGMYLPQQDGETGFENSLTAYYNNTPNNILFGTNKQRIYYSQDAGLSWSAIPVPNENTYSISSIGRYTLSAGNNLYSTSNNGSPWQFETSLGTGNINGVVMSGLIIAIPSDNILTVPVLYIRSDNRIYYSDNGGGSDWEVKYSASSGTYSYITTVANTIWAVRDNGSITKGEIDVITSVDPVTYPYSFELRQNYPNPFNPKTTIPILLYRSTHISLKVYNSSGELAATLLDGQKDLAFYDNIPYGYYYSVEWDASAYPSGVYYYQVISDDYKETRKMMLIK
jgi:hypothetical protein